MSGILERMEATLARVEAKVDQLLAGGPVVPPIDPVDPVDPPPIDPPATGPNCNYAGPYIINTVGTVNNVCLCSPAVVQIQNGLGGTITWVKMPGTGQPAVPLGMVTVRENGQVVNQGGSGSAFSIGPGNRELTFTAEVPCTNLSVQLR
jgi:hypothetical protein